MPADLEVRVRRFLILNFLLIVGCQAPPQRPVAPVLPEDTGPQPFADLAGRARQQAMNALEAYYVDHWAEVEDAAKGLEQSARFLRKAVDVPADRKADLGVRADSLADAAKQLRDAAHNHASEQVNAVLQRINSQVRELR
jgi:hypothetical protein